EAVPAGDLMRLDDRARGIIDRAAEADADAADFIPCSFSARKQLRNREQNLPANAVRHLGRNDGAAPKGEDMAVARTEAELQFHPADFDAEVHDNTFY